ncbi:Smr/MutS family protein [uncultured Desulfuromonas sp.]|uniref:Smr/MutS family protein n=1 Tax=uncultured Desulfuromonas sp. TaxID=181013 RepID=UPI00262185D5|nr:Smr/MutS family protein [uncultured Desulfuromonas sp.]
MAKKNKDQGRKAFQNSPFKTLKGLSGFKEEKPQSGPVVPPAPAAPQGRTTDAEAFALEMAKLGVKTTGEGQGRQDRPLSEESTRADAAPPSPGLGSDGELFLEALGKMDVTFRDEIPEPDEEPKAQPRRMKQVRKGALTPEAELDLHGLTREEARQKVRYFLEDALYKGLRTVVVVTGRGNHSGGEPVLRGEVERLLEQEGRKWALEWGRAPRQYGGEGALLVFLKGAKQEG